MRISKPGYDALTETDIYNYSIYADSDNVLIKEKARGSGTIAYPGSETINHALGYIPFYLCYCEVGANDRYRIANAFDPIGSGWKTYVTTADLEIENAFSATYNTYRYYLFYDDMD